MSSRKRKAESGTLEGGVPLQRGQDFVVPDFATERQAAILLGEESSPEVCDECGRFLRDRRMFTREEFYDAPTEQSARWTLSLLADGSVTVCCGGESLRFCPRCLRQLARYLFRFSRSTKE